MAAANNKKFYLIRLKDSWRGYGFFYNFYCVFSEIVYAHNHGLIPVVDMQNHPTIYNETEPVNGTRNNWEYFFEPVSGYTLEYATVNAPKLNIKYSGGESNLQTLRWWYPARRPTKRDIASLQPILEQYIRLKPAIAAAHQDNLRRLAGRRTLGVHYRGTDIYHERLMPPLDWWIDISRRAFDKGRFGAVFLATDEQAAVEAFKSAFGDRLIMNKSLRAPKGSRTGIHLNNSKSLRQKGVRYKLGKEVLLDALTLAGCDSLVCGYSNVAMAAILFNGNRYRKVIMPHGVLK